MRILTIDSDPARREVVEQSAAARGHEFASCANLDRGLELLRETPHDLIFVGPNGNDPEDWSECGILRGATNGANSLIIAFTADGDLGSATAALTCGADDFLQGLVTDKNLDIQIFVAEQRIRRTPAHSAQVLEAINAQDQIGVAFLNQNGEISTYNATTPALLTDSQEKIAGRALLDFLSERKEHDDGNLKSVLDGKKPGYRTEGCCSDRQEPTWVKVVVTRIEASANPERFAVALIEDISNQRKLESKLQHQSLYDSLTSLPNRGLFLDRVAHVMKRTKREPESSFAVLYVDVDRFKSMNDSVGREYGDQLLVSLSKRLVKSIRPTDTVCRLGGDEFTILLEEIKAVADATRIAERIKEELIEPIRVDGQDIFLTVSIGIVTSESGYGDPEEIIRDADTAMHRAKSLGKGQYYIFDREMRSKVAMMLSLEQDLRRALEKDEFWVAYQPIISLNSGQIYGLEALVRWTHSERGLISPGDFIPLAEETGVILSLGQWVLGEACGQVQKWHTQFTEDQALHISVNVSSKQFADPKLVHKVEHLLEKTGLNPEALSLEITESVVMEKSESATSALANLQRLGIDLHMDDFGTGYSSLAYLHKFPMDALKIDRSFIMRMDQEVRTIELVRTIINLARTLRLSVVAEGVETQKHLDALRALGCDYAQGYFFSKPLNAEGIGELLASQPQW